ncbi:hypothetical protein A3N57_15225 [Enterobacter cloacae subsp. dissolvens]|uniref:restriction endonuclease subunit S n=1 Tax=Enterobacter cloacae TaxID=550 RepID=UPI0007B39357|nr:restriction endonuclease subunit S [Enterobacter cloacae]KZQ39076.1 hypothetical protein A3N57_15225 [Enterobacter cloacae subsp. dissolvens]
MSEWIVTPLGELVSFQKGRKVATSPFPLNGYAPYLGAGALSGDHDGYASSLFAVQANEDDVLMLWDGERSGLCRSGLKGIVSSTVCKLTPKKNIHSELLYYLLANKYEWIQARRTGTGVPHVPKDIGRILELKFPSCLKVQNKIVDILISIDQSIEKTNILVGKYQKIKIGLMNDLLSRGVDHDGKLRASREHLPESYQETSLGWFPKDWQLKRVKDVFNIDSGITLGSHRRPKKNARPYLRVANVFKEKISLKDVSLLEATDSEASRYALKKYDLLVVEGHANIQQIGRCAIVDNNAEGLLFQNHLFRLQAKTISPYYGMYYLNSAIARKYWEMNCSTSSGLNTINRTMLGNMPFFVPARTEQASIEEKLNGISLLLKNEIDLLVKLRAQKIGLINDLLTGKVPVQSKDTEAPHV